MIFLYLLALIGFVALAVFASIGLRLFVQTMRRVEEELRREWQ